VIGSYWFVHVNVDYEGEHPERGHQYGVKLDWLDDGHAKPRATSGTLRCTYIGENLGQMLDDLLVDAELLGVKRETVSRGTIAEGAFSKTALIYKDPHGVGIPPQIVVAIRTAGVARGFHVEAG